MKKNCYACKIHVSETELPLQYTSLKYGQWDTETHLLCYNCWKKMFDFMHGKRNNL